MQPAVAIMQNNKLAALSLEACFAPIAHKCVNIIRSPMCWIDFAPFAITHDVAACATLFVPK